MVAHLSRFLVILAIVPSSVGAQTQPAPTGILSPEADRAYYEGLMNRARAMDKVVIEHGTGISKAMPGVSDLPKFIVQSVKEFLFGKVQEAMVGELTRTSKLAEPIAPVERAIAQHQVMSNVWVSDPNQRKKFEGEAERMHDRERMRLEYAVPNFAFCTGIPPLACNQLSPGRIECAGGPQHPGAQGIPPWYYTLIAKCEGARFIDFESFEPRASVNTVVRTTDIPGVGRIYNGAAYASFCVPCTKSSPTRPRGPVNCEANPTHPQCR